MTKDIIYIFDKITGIRSILGEVQKNFNMSFVIDGTKDTCSMEVWGFEESNIEPNTILYHPKTNTWWVVSHDKVERYENDSGFLYIHNLDLQGAIELLNSRDLTDCGFNSDTYTIRQFLDRLFDLSNFEYNRYHLDANNTDYHIVHYGSIDLDKKVEFVKTFENYTLLSAIREFLDAYNCSAKLIFDTVTVNTVTYLITPTLLIITKTGDPLFESHNMDFFDDIRETKTMDKNSFGTIVVSNAENVISSATKTYPSIGATKTSAHEYNIIADNAIIRLPSKVFKGNWLALVTSRAFVECIGNVENDAVSLTPSNLHLNPIDNNSFNTAIDRIYEVIYGFDSSSGLNGAFFEPFKEALESQKQRIRDEITKASTIKLYSGNELNPVDGTVIKGDEVPYLARLDFWSKNSGGTNRPYIFCDKETKGMLKYPWSGIAWERGSDEITGFDGFEPDTARNATVVVRNLLNTDLQANVSLLSYNALGSNEIYVYFHFFNAHGDIYIRTPLNGSYNIHFRDQAQWIVNYVPMSDIKIKVDNFLNKRDTHLYNQTGKLTDNYSLSKLIHSYSKEISSNTITKYMWFTDYNSIPTIGSIVNYGEEQYVINNISLTFTQNETISPDTTFGYYIECEFTMSKYVAVKSLLVNPDTNIRDYGIPQNFNVKRKQLYRDFYELTYTLEEDSDLVPTNTEGSSTKTIYSYEWIQIGGPVSVTVTAPTQSGFDDEEFGTYSYINPMLAGETLSYMSISKTIDNRNNTVSFDNEYDAGVPLDIVGRFTGRIYSRDGFPKSATLTYQVSGTPDPYWIYSGYLSVPSLVGKDVSNIQLSGFVGEIQTLSFDASTGTFYLYLKTTYQPSTMTFTITYTYLVGNRENFYLLPNDVFNFTHYPIHTTNLVGLIKLDYDMAIEGSYSYYYQLETTKYDMSKMFYVMLDFKDNNIIGYGNQNVYSGFIISRVFSGQIDALNTPISYVDENGEVKNITIRWVDNTQLTNIYNEYIQQNSGESGYSSFISSGGTLYNYSVFIPNNIYDSAQYNKKFEIAETNYKKDALEVPVFEYACQMGDTPNISIGDKFFAEEDDCLYFYSYEIGDNITLETAKTDVVVEQLTSPLRLRVLGSVDMAFYSNEIFIRIYSATTFNVENNTWENFTQNNLTANKDYAIFRHIYNRKTGKSVANLLFVIKKLPSSNIRSGNVGVLKINHYKLK